MNILTMGAMQQVRNRVTTVPVSTNNLITAIEMQETSGTKAYDSHSTNNDYSITGTVTLGSTGVSQSELPNAFTYGGGFLDPDNSMGISSTNFTVSVWLYPTNTSGINPISRGGGRSWYVYGGNVEVYDAAWTNIQYSISTNEWTHAVWTWDSSNDIELYKNGVLADSGNYNNNRSFGNPSVARDSSRETFDGRMAQFCIWQRVLSSDEIETLYNNGDGLAYSNW